MKHCWWALPLVLAVLSGGSAQADLLVTIRGAVQSPGPYILQDRATLGDLVRQAGGLAPRADLRSLNLNTLLQKGGDEITVIIPFQDSSSKNKGEESIIRRRTYTPPTFTKDVALNTQGQKFLGKAVVAWDLQHFPLKVWIEAPPPDSPTIYSASIRKGMNAWNSLWAVNMGPSVGTYTAFEEISDPNKADITVQWAELNGSTAGITRPQLEPVKLPRGQLWQRIDHVSINMDLIQEGGQLYDAQSLEDIMTHEFGHALGLLGHSLDPKDLMHPIYKGPNRQIFTPETLNRLRATYQAIKNPPRS
jgi:hypothetical protein